MTSRSSINTTRQKLSRLSRKIDDAGGLSTVDPLMAEIMIAHTHSNLAVAEAIQEQNQIMQGMRDDGYSSFMNYPDSATRQYQKDQTDNWKTLLKLMDTLVANIKDAVKILRGRL